jgi:hypothetical protein
MARQILWKTQAVMAENIADSLPVEQPADISRLIPQQRHQRIQIKD